MLMPSLRPRMPVLVLLTLLFTLLSGLPTPARAQTVTATPALAAPGIPVTLRLKDGLIGTSYRFYLGSGQVNPVVLGDATFLSPRAGAALTVNLPSAAAGRTRIVVRAGTSALNPVVASMTFDVLPALTFSFPQATVHGGQRLAYNVGNLRTGTLEISYAGRLIAGPFDVTPSTTSGRAVLPTSNPTLPATVRVEAVNRVGTTIINRRAINLSVQAPLQRPYTIGVTQTPTSVRPGQVYGFGGSLSVGANERAPTSVTHWYVGADNNIFPLGEAVPAPVSGQPGQYTYQANVVAPGIRAGTAGGASASGSVRVGTRSSTTFGVDAPVVTQPANPQMSTLPLDRWRLTVRVRKPGGLPIAGAVVLLDGMASALVEPGSGGALDGLTVAPTLAAIEQATPGSSQFATFMTGYDPFGCPLTLGRTLTNPNGEAVLEFDAQSLMMLAQARSVAQIGAGDPENTGAGGVGPIQFAMQLGVNASAQGYGYVNNGDYLPHVYNVQFFGVDNPDVPDQIVITDAYQGVVMLDVASRAATFTLPTLAAMDAPRVQLLDVSAVPWAARQFSASLGGGPTQFDAVRFGPAYSTRLIGGTPGVNRAGWPTHIDVRFDQAVSGTISNARLLMDLDRNGGYETNIAFAPAPGYSPPCDAIGSLDQNRTWRAEIPTALRVATGGRYAGLLFFSNGSNTETRIVQIDVRDVPAFTQGNPQYTSVSHNFARGGQDVRVSGVEDGGDAEVQLQRDPGYEIGNLRNANRHERPFVIGFSAATGNTPVEYAAPLETNSRMAGLLAPPRTNDLGATATFNPSPQVLIDESFPLFYYVWGVPLLAGIEVGANFSLYSDITFSGSTSIQPSTGRPLLTMTTEPSIDLGLEFYIDLDVLFDLVDAGVSTEATFGLDLPISVQNGVVQNVGYCFRADLTFSYWIDFSCFPLDLICEAASALIESEDTIPLLYDRVPSGCAPPPQPEAAAMTGGGAVQRVLPNHATVAYSPDGDGVLAFVRRPNTDAAPAELVVRPVDSGLFSRFDDETVLSTAIGIRSIALAWYAPNRAVAVWAENSTGTYASYRGLHPTEKVRRQRLMFSTFDGARWTAKRALTSPGSGEGGVALAACFAGDSGCPATGEVIAAWVRDPAADITQRRGRIFHATFGGTAWTLPTAVDAAANNDASPTVTYANGSPVIGFVRTGTNPGTAALRRFAYRFVRNATAPVVVPAQIGTGVVRASLALDRRNNLVAVMNRDADGRGIVGNTAQLAAATMSGCSTGTCTTVAFADLRDSRGRLVYADRPQAMRDASGNVKVVFRGLGYGPDLNGAMVRADGDPLGMVLHTGELMQASVNVSTGRVLPVVMSGDGAGHLRPSAAIDPQTGAVIATSTALAIAPNLARHRAALAKSDLSIPAARGKLLGEGDLAVFGAALGPDLAVESVTLSTPRVVSGQAVSATVTVRNRGGDYDATAPAWLLRLSWNGPAGTGVAATTPSPIQSIDAGAARTYVIPLVVPAGTTNDREITLVVELDANDSSEGDRDGDNNLRTLTANTLDVPVGVVAMAPEGTGITVVGWAAPTDDRVLGHRIWYRDAPGSRWRHLGSSFGDEFIDLNAPPGRPRWYRVTTYTANLVESAPSAETMATATLPDRLFGNGFEGSPAP